MQKIQPLDLIPKKEENDYNQYFFLLSLIGILKNKDKDSAKYSSYCRREGIVWTSSFFYLTEKEAIDAAKDKAWEWFIYEKPYACILVKISTWEVLCTNFQASNLAQEFKKATKSRQILKSVVLKLGLNEKIKLGINQEFEVEKVGINSLICKISND